ncbi:adenine phosphoribosyltransferase [Granulicoccus sp. GXG6511]|uniref:adenine phosphoribosyltransferase n=1 Tax=Granulicoccus sp. GXG6511 TaxID=3381351 RepID=UPI003D7D5A3E
MPVARSTPQETLSALIADVPDFPRPGVVFKDITPLLADPDGFRMAVDGLVELAPPNIDIVVGMEARGFIMGAPVAHALGVGFVPVRKPGKLPRPTLSATFALEYGTDELLMHADALGRGMRVLIVDDVLATGGTVAATAELVRSLDADLAGVAVLLELGFLGARARLLEAGLDRIDALLTVES